MVEHSLNAGNLTLTCVPRYEQRTRQWFWRSLETLELSYRWSLPSNFIHSPAFPTTLLNLVQAQFLATFQFQPRSLEEKVGGDPGSPPWILQVEKWALVIRENGRFLWGDETRQHFWEFWEFSVYQEVTAKVADNSELLLCNNFSRRKQAHLRKYSMNTLKLSKEQGLWTTSVKGTKWRWVCVWSEWSTLSKI